MTRATSTLRRQRMVGPVEPLGSFGFRGGGRVGSCSRGGTTIRGGGGGVTRTGGDGGGTTTPCGGGTTTGVGHLRRR